MQNIEKKTGELDQEQGESRQLSENQNSYRTLIPLLLGAGLIIFFDQWTKHLVIDNIPFLGTWIPENFAQYHTFIRIVHWRNSGAAFGMFSNGNIIFLILAIIASIFIIAFYPLIDKEEWPLRIAMVLQLGGALGNMIDRIRFGYVIDFISVRDLPVFNIADASISTGVAILLLGVLFQEYKTQKLNKSLDNFSRTDTSRHKEAE